MLLNDVSRRCGCNIYSNDAKLSALVWIAELSACSLCGEKKRVLAFPCRHFLCWPQYSTWALNLWMSSEALTSSAEDREEEWLWGWIAEKHDWKRKEEWKKQRSTTAEVKKTVVSYWSICSWKKKIFAKWVAIWCLFCLSSKVWNCKEFKASNTAYLG